MRKYLLPESGNFYKSNLHCHTVISDGNLTPEQIKERYLSLGYSIVAFTDHDVFIPHNDLTDDRFLAMNGFEVEIHEESDRWSSLNKTCHICFVALDPENDIQPMWNEAYAGKSKDLVKYDKTAEPHIRTYSAECISDMMKTGRDAGFFVTYNHPDWSRERYPQYMSYEGMHAFEIMNGGCLVEGFDDYNPRVFDDFLFAGKKLYCIGADDNHNAYPIDSRRNDSGIAFTVIKAESLEYSAIADALLKGHFYASEGPSIEELWVEGDKVHIKCSPADRIVCSYEARRGEIEFDETGDGITEADFNISPSRCYMRITVIDKSGRHACTNAYFPEE